MKTVEGSVGRRQRRYLDISSRNFLLLEPDQTKQVHTPGRFKMPVRREMAPSRRDVVGFHESHKIKETRHERRN